jgi:hypothetical protein
MKTNQQAFNRKELHPFIESNFVPIHQAAVGVLVLACALAGLTFGHGHEPDPRLSLNPANTAGLQHQEGHHGPIGEKQSQQQQQRRPKSFRKPRKTGERQVIYILNKRQKSDCENSTVHLLHS